MDFALNRRQRDWRAECHRFALDVMRPHAIEADEREEVPAPVIEAAAAQGLYGPELLPAVGEDDQGLLPVLYMEELAWGCAGMAIALGAAMGAVGIIGALGTPEQSAYWIPRCFSDGNVPRLAAWAQTEPAAGSDAAAIQLRAEEYGDGWVLNGEKTMVGNGGIAATTLVVASVDPRLGFRGQAHFIVPEGTPGVSVTRVNSKLGLRAGRLVDLRFDDCRLDEELLIGGSKRLRKRLRRTSTRAPSGGSPGGAQRELGRALMAATAVGVARAALEIAASALARSRRAHEQYVQHALADATTELDAARLLVWRAAWMARTGIPFERREGSMAKLKAGEAVVAITSSLLELVGWDAIQSDALLAKCFRDAKAFQIMEGTTQIQRTTVGSQLLRNHQRDPQSRTV